MIFILKEYMVVLSVVTETKRKRLEMLIVFGSCFEGSILKIFFLFLFFGWVDWRKSWMVFREKMWNR